MAFTGSKYGNGSDSSVGKQFRTDHYDRAALIDTAPKMYLQQFSDSAAMPKHFGKEIVKYHYIPLLDDRNVNDQGLDATGNSISNGNLYGSSTDIGTITGKLPALREEGGEVNRVGYVRKEVKSSIKKLGFYNEFTEDSIQFDTDHELMRHFTREAMVGANKMSEQALTVDLIGGAGTVMYAGTATSVATLTGEGTNVSVISYADLQTIDVALDDAECPMEVDMIKGSKLTDTRTLPSCRAMVIPSHLKPVFQNMKDESGNAKFVPVEQYADAAKGNILNGEIGAVGNFRIVSIPNMPNDMGKGASATSANKGYRFSNGKYDVYTCLVIGKESFATIGFQGDGKGGKFKTNVVTPKSQASFAKDPYGVRGNYSIQWHYGTLIQRPEWLVAVKTVAPK